MTLPIDFCVKGYRKNNIDLKELDDTEAVFHYLLKGNREQRKYKDAICNPHVVISIITYKNNDILEECLTSIKNKTKYKNFKVVITDNAAEKNVQRTVQRFRYNSNLDIEYRRTKENEFFSRPNNRVINQFKNSDIILLNDDTVIKTECWITELQNSAYLVANIACAGGKPIMQDGKLEEAGSMILNNGYTHSFGKNEDPNKEEYNQRKFVGYCSGSMLYMRRDAINKVGLLDENFKPLYYEDTDWQYRAHIIGLKTIYEPKCEYIHKGRSTTRGRLNEYVDNCRRIFLEKYKGYNLEDYAD